MGLKIRHQCWLPWTVGSRAEPDLAVVGSGDIPQGRLYSMLNMKANP